MKRQQKIEDELNLKLELEVERELLGKENTTEESIDEYDEDFFEGFREVQVEEIDDSVNSHRIVENLMSEVEREQDVQLDDTVVDDFLQEEEDSSDKDLLLYSSGFVAQDFLDYDDDVTENEDDDYIKGDTPRNKYNSGVGGKVLFGLFLVFLVITCYFAAQSKDSGKLDEVGDSGKPQYTDEEVENFISQNQDLYAEIESLKSELAKLTSDSTAVAEADPTPEIVEESNEESGLSSVNPPIANEIIPLSPVVVAEPEPKPEPITYVVQENDTLSKISIKFYGNHRSYQRIIDANGLDNDAIKLGQTLIIP